MTTDEQLAAAIERIRQLEAALLTINAVAAPPAPAYVGDQIVISVTELDYERHRLGLPFLISVAEQALANVMFPMSATQTLQPEQVYRLEKLKLVKARTNYAIYMRIDERHVGIAGLPAGTDLRGLVADEVRSEYDYARDRTAISIRGHIPRKST